MGSGASWEHCEARSAATIPFSFAYQPIVDVQSRTIVSYEALIRGPNQESAASVLGQASAEQLHILDERGRDVAIALARQLGIECCLNLNFLPQGLLASFDSIEGTLEAASRCGLELDRLILEVSETEMIHDRERFTKLVNGYRGRGV
jgi:EAL domain-containing protein (putative c-di-GMP-specific phosphodiesterase class I)